MVASLRQLPPLPLKIIAREPVSVTNPLENWSAPLNPVTVVVLLELPEV